MTAMMDRTETDTKVDVRKLTILSNAGAETIEWTPGTKSETKARTSFDTARTEGYWAAGKDTDGSAVTVPTFDQITEGETVMTPQIVGG